MSIIKTRTHKGQTGGGSHLTPEEKLKASGAVVPPFIVSESTDNNTSRALWVYGSDGSTKVEDNGTTYKKNIILGAHSDYSATGGSGLYVYGHNSEPPVAE